MNCPFCTAENGTKANYCSSCGSPLHLRVCRHCDGVNDKTAIACINCGGALVAETALPAGPAVATRVTARLAVMGENVIDLDAIGCACADNGRRENNWPQGGWERAWPENIRAENIWQQTNRGASGAEVGSLLRHIDEEIHRLEARPRHVPAVAPRAALQMSGPGAKPRAAAPEPKSLSVNNLALRCRPKAMDARRGSPPNVVHWARFATPQTRFWATTLRATAHLSASLCRKPLVVKDTTARLASRPASQMGPGAGLNYSRTSSELFNPQPATNSGVVETQRFSWRTPVLFVVSISIGIASYFSLPPEPSTMLAGSEAVGKRIGRGIAALPPDSKAMTAIALVHQPAKFDRAIATRFAVVPQTRANLPARPDNPLASPLGELVAAKVQGKRAPPESSAAAGSNKAGNGLDVRSVRDAGNPLGSQTRPGVIAAVSDLAVRAGSAHPKPLRASSKTSRRNAMLRASLQADVEPVRHQLY